MPDQQHDLSVRHFLDLFGGGKGLFDSSLPVLVFLGVKLASGSLNAGLVAAVVAGLAVVAYRKSRGETLQHAGSGFFGLLLAVVFARATGSGKGFFYPGIALTGLTGVGFLVSVLVRKPAVALALVAIDPKYAVWETHEPLRRACTRATWFWTATFFIRAAVAAVVAASVGDSVKDNSLLFGIIQVEKFGLIALAALYTLNVVRAVELPEPVEVPEP